MNAYLEYSTYSLKVPTNAALWASYTKERFAIISALGKLVRSCSQFTGRFINVH